MKERSEALKGMFKDDKYSMLGRTHFNESKMPIAISNVKGTAINVYSSVGKTNINSFSFCF